MSKVTTIESEYRGHCIRVSDEGTYDPNWETRTIYFSIYTVDGMGCMDSFVFETGDTLETYMDIMQRHVDASYLNPADYWGWDDDEDNTE